MYQAATRRIMDGMTGWRLGHRPALDGVRGLAILLVLLDHVGLLPGAGPVGVTVFFTLSGFLITRVIIEAREAGRWSFGWFFGNRMARLFPALAVCVTGVTAWWVLSGRPVGEIGGYAAAAITYTGNFPHGWNFGMVLDHTWSLAVEEQFYLVWPFALVPLLRSRVWFAWLAVVAVASVLLRFYLAGDSINMAYVSLGANAFPLLAGCALGIAAPRLRQAPQSVGPLAMTALAGVVAGAAAWSAPFVDMTLAGLVSVPLVWVAMTAGVPIALDPLRFLGRISYSLYLWNWPLLWLTGTVHAGWQSVPVLLTGLAVATASTLWLEEPIRRWWRARGRVRGQAPARLTTAARIALDDEPAVKVMSTSGPMPVLE